MKEFSEKRWKYCKLNHIIISKNSNRYTFCSVSVAYEEKKCATTFLRRQEGDVTNMCDDDKRWEKVLVNFLFFSHAYMRKLHIKVIKVTRMSSLFQQTHTHKKKHIMVCCSRKENEDFIEWGKCVNNIIFGQ